MFMTVVTILLFLASFAFFAWFLVGTLKMQVNLLNLSLYATCFFITAEWYIDFQGLLISPIYDFIFAVCCIWWTSIIIKKRYYRFPLIQTLIILFTAYYSWQLFAFIVQKERIGLQIFWSWYRTDFIAVIFLLAGIVLAFRPKHVQKAAFLFLLSSYLIAGLLGITQSVTRGRYLASIQNQRYVGLLTPLPKDTPNASESRISDFERGRQVGVGGGFFYNGIFRAAGTQTGGSTFAIVMVTGICLCTGAIISREKYKQKLQRLTLFALPILLLGLFLTFTRSAYLGVLLTFSWVWLYWFFMGRKIGWGFLALLGSILISALFLLLVTLGPLNFLISRFDVIVARLMDLANPLEAETFQWRLKIWAYVWDLVIQSPIFGSDQRLYLAEIFGGIYELRPEDITTPHSEYVQALYKGGFPLLLIYLGMHFWLFVKTCYRNQRKNVDSIGLTWIISTNLSMLALFITGIGFNWFAGINLQGFFWLLAATSISVISQTQKMPHVPSNLYVSREARHQFIPN